MKTIQDWKKRALPFARSLQGRPHTPDEQEIIDKRGRDGYFRVFGIQPETQGYINETINQIDGLAPDDWENQLIAEIRLDWSVKALKEGGK